MRGLDGGLLLRPVGGAAKTAIINHGRAATSDTAVERIAVLGAGAWGTALAVQFERAGRRVTLWGRNPALMAELQRCRVNNRYLPGIELGKNLTATTSHDICDDGVISAMMAWI